MMHGGWLIEMLGIARKHIATHGPIAGHQTSAVLRTRAYFINIHRVSTQIKEQGRVDAGRNKLFSIKPDIDIKKTIREKVCETRNKHFIFCNPNNFFFEAFFHALVTGESRKTRKRLFWFLQARGKWWFVGRWGDRSWSYVCFYWRYFRLWTIARSNSSYRFYGGFNWIYRQRMLVFYEVKQWIVLLKLVLPAVEVDLLQLWVNNEVS